MNRTTLGERLCQWHGSMHDPVYAVGSFYVSNQRYPEKQVVEHAITNLLGALDQFKRMLQGETVWVVRQGVQVSLRKFAEYTTQEMRDHRDDLQEIIDALLKQKMEDYK